MKMKRRYRSMSSGFRENHSTETASQIVLQEWKEASDEGKRVIGALFLVLMREFETGNISIILS